MAQGGVAVALEEDVTAAVPDSEAGVYQCAGGEVLTVAPASVADVMGYLKGRGFDLFVDLTAVDRIASKGVIEVVYQLASTETSARLMIKAAADSGDPVVPSIASLWAGANWAERECWDMFGVRFEGHPDPRRILMYEEFVGHPLRKDYPYDKRQPLVEERDPINDPWPARELKAATADSPGEGGSKGR